MSVSCSETRSAFNSGFVTGNLHRPTVRAPDVAHAQLRQPRSDGRATSPLSLFCLLMVDRTIVPIRTRRVSSSPAQYEQAVREWAGPVHRHTMSKQPGPAHRPVLALLDQLLQARHALLQRHHGVLAVEHGDVDVRRVQLLQRPRRGGDQVGGRGVVQEGARPRVHPDLHLGPGRSCSRIPRHRMPLPLPLKKRWFTMRVEGR